MKDAILTLDWELLSNFSYRSQLGKSLKNTLRKFNKDDLFDELNAMISYFTEMITEQALVHENRIKSLHSCALKYEKYYPSTELEKVFNDVLGLRIVLDEYSMFDNLIFPENVHVADMRNGKAKDDGYRGIHVYFQKDHFHYPIEMQFMTEHDRQFNEWLHIYLYKYTDDKSIGIILRDMYEDGQIISEEHFREEMKKLCATL